MIIGEKVGMRTRVVNKKQSSRRWKHVGNAGGICFAGVTSKTTAAALRHHRRGAWRMSLVPAEKRPKNEVRNGGAICTTSRQKWAMDGGI